MGSALARRPTALSMADVTALCARLDERANSMLAAQDPQVCSDMRLAAAVIRRMQAAFHSSDLLAVPADASVVPGLS
jgi:hypothetical protein